MQRRDFLQSGLLLGTAGLLPGVGLSASELFPSAIDVPEIEAENAWNYPYRRVLRQYVNYRKLGRGRESALELAIKMSSLEDDALVYDTVINTDRHYIRSLIERWYADMKRYLATEKEVEAKIETIRPELDAKIEESVQKSLCEFFAHLPNLQPSHRLIRGSYDSSKQKILLSDYGIVWKTPEECDFYFDKARDYAE